METKEEERKWNGITSSNHLGGYFPTTPKELIALGSGLWEQIQQKGNLHYPVTLEEAERTLKVLESMKEKSTTKHNRREVPWKKK